MYVCAGFIADHLTMTPQGLAALWLGNAILASAFLILPFEWLTMVAASALAADFLVYTLVGRAPLDRAIVVALLDLGEALVAAVLIRRHCGAALNILRVRRLRALVVCAILPATVLTAMIYALLAALMHDQAPLWPFLRWFAGDFLSMLVAIPAILLIARTWRREGGDWLVAARQGAIPVGLVAAVVIVGSQNLMLFFVVPVAMLLATFYLAPSRVALALLLLTATTAYMTVYGVGPFAAYQQDLAPRVLLLQSFLGATALASLTASALLHERERARCSLRRTLRAAREARWAALQAVHAKGKFLNAMSHELRTPLNGVLGYAQLIASRKDLPGDVDQQIAEVISCGWATVSLIDNILEFSRLDAARTELTRTPFRLVDLVEQAIQDGRGQLACRPVTLFMRLGPHSEMSLLGDAQRIAQVLKHLIDNAVKFTERGEITVALEVIPCGPSAAKCLVSVRDTGAGIQPEARDALFEPFQRGDDSTVRKHDGPGLGLALVKSIVNLMGGRIELESAPGAGSEFRVELPVLRGPDAARRIKPRSIMSAPTR